MPRLDFMEQFQAIGYSMAKKAKTEVQEINKLKDKKMKEVNSEFIQMLLRDLRIKTETFVRNYETQLNQQISENVKDLNLKILTKKNEMFEDFKQSLMRGIDAHIKDNYDSYLRNMITKIKKNSKFLKNTVYIQLNNKDKNEFQKIQAEIGNKKLLLEPKILECIGGYKLSNSSSTIVISDTIEDLLEKNIYSLRMNFSKIFPEYIDRRKSATELMKERNITISSSIPEEVKEYMIKHNIEFPEK